MHATLHIDGLVNVFGFYGCVCSFMAVVVLMFV